MPVQKFRTFEEARRALWRKSSDPELPMIIRALWRRSALFAPPVARPGVQKFRSVEEANRERDQVTTDRIARLQRERSRVQS